MATVGKLIVEVVDARDLAPKDGHGTSSPYAVVDFYGQRKKTKTMIRDLNPVWNETLEFNVGKPSDVLGDMLELDVFHDKNIGPTTRNNFLGRVRLSSRQFVKKGEEALIYYPLEKKNVLSWIQGEIGLKIYFIDEAVPPPAPPPPPPEKPEPEQTAPTTDAPLATPATEAATKPLLLNESEGPKSAATKPPLLNESEGPKSDEADTLRVSEPSPKEEETQKDVNVVEAARQENDKVIPNPDQKEEKHDGMEQTMASIASRSVPEVKVNNISGPQPISRVSSVSSFISDTSEMSKMEHSAFDLVEKMYYLFVRVVKARSLPTFSFPVVKIAISGSSNVISKPARKTTLFEWDQTFALARDSSQSDTSTILEISVWDLLLATSGRTPIVDMAGQNFLGGICFDVSEIPIRDPPDSSLAPQWYRLEGGGANKGDLMLATWIGTQADESFPDAWKTDTAGNPSSKSKVYQSPKLWYLRSTVIEAQDILSSTTSVREWTYQIKAQLGFQVQKTRLSVTSNGSPSWNEEDLIFVAAEPFTENVITFSLIENRSPKGPIVIGVASLPLTSIERRVDDRNVASRWFTFEDPNEEARVYKGRVHLRLCFDGGYHVMDEAAHVCSDYRPTARQLWKPPVGTIELGIIGCKNLLPMKTIKGKGSTDAYAVAKYGSKWVRTRTVSDRLDPKWNEQYTWRMYDPSTVLTVGVFDSWETLQSDSDSPNESIRPDFRMGKVRIRISTLSIGKVYRNTYPLLLFSQSGLKKMGDIEIAIRAVRSAPTLDFLHVYSQPLLPMMHHVKPLGIVHQEALRSTAVKIVTAHLSRSEPPLRREVVTYMLDADSCSFSMRKVRANWFRIINIVARVIDIVKWVEDTRSWKNPMATILVHFLLIMLTWFPDLIGPTLAIYVFAIGAWNYRFRYRQTLPHFDPKLSLAETTDRDEIDEEFDLVPCNRPNEVIRVRYDKLRMLGARVQTALGDFATQGERVQALVTWRDPRATGIFMGFCFVVAFILYLIPSKMIAMAFGFYYLRHPLFRDRMPSPALNFFRRLPSLSDRML